MPFLYVPSFLIDVLNTAKMLRVDVVFVFSACKRKDGMEEVAGVSGGPKKPRLVFTDLQRRTLQAIFKVCVRSCEENVSFCKDLPSGSFSTTKIPFYNKL